jgi:5-methylthioadenosine/S-adenosylhomocysteine deaminase
VARMLASGMTVGLGTDDANANSNVSILREMRQAALLAKVRDLDAGALTAEKVLEMATIDGARALGLDPQIGSLEPGKRADLVLLDREAPHWHPMHHVASTIVYQAQSADVRTVLIDGIPVLDERVLRFLSPDEQPVLLERAQRASEAIVRRAGMTALRERGWQRTSVV